MESPISDQSDQLSASSTDRFEDVFTHHIAEIEQVWQQLNVARATAAKLRPSKSRPSQLRLKYPLPLSAIQQIANLELQNMRDYEEEEDGEVAESINKEAGVLLSFLAAMFIENLSIKTMYHLPQQKMFGIQRNNPTTPENHASSSSAPTEPVSLDPSHLFPSVPSITPVSLVITREDIRRALLRDEQFDFLVQSGLAQPGQSDPFNLQEEQTDTLHRTNSDHVHLGYWKIVERTFSALEMAPTSPSAPIKTISHNPTHLASKIMMKLSPESDPSHAHFTLFPGNEDLGTNSIEFSIHNNSPSANGTGAKLSGRVKLGHIDIVSLEGNSIQLSPSTDTNHEVHDSDTIPPMNFFWDKQNEEDENFPLAGRPTSAKGHGSVQLFDSYTAYDTFRSPWLQDCSWGVLSLELTFQLGDTGFNLHNHYLAIPVFVQPPTEA